MNQKRKIKSYQYDFDLGVTRNGTNLGGGDVVIAYYSTEDFKSMQYLEEYYLLQVNDILAKNGYLPLDLPAWTDVDYACPTPYNSDLQARQNTNPPPSNKTHIAFPSPHSQQSSERSKLRIARGTQAKPTLAIRALLVQFLAGGGGEVPTKVPDNNLQLRIPGLTYPLTPC